MGTKEEEVIYPNWDIWQSLQRADDLWAKSSRTHKSCLDGHGPILVKPFLVEGAVCAKAYKFKTTSTYLVNKTTSCFTYEWGGVGWERPQTVN